MADYPDWVMAHKKKGTYINKVGDKYYNKVGDKYYLYAAHSERVPGTKKVKRVFDGYLGRITQDQGLIPAKQKLPGYIKSYEYGLSSLILEVCSDIHKTLCRSFVVYGDFVMAAATLTYIYGFYSTDLYQASWLSLRFLDSSVPDVTTPEQESGIRNGVFRISETMNRTFGSALDEVKAYFSLILLHSAEKQWYCSEPPSRAQELIKKYELSWRPDQWEKYTTSSMH